MTSMSLNRSAMAVTISVSRSISQRAFRSTKAAVVAVPTRMSLMGGVARPRHRVKEARLLCVAGSSLMMRRTPGTRTQPWSRGAPHRRPERVRSL